MKPSFLAVLPLLAALVAGCRAEPVGSNPAVGGADTIYLGAILTIDDAHPRAEALAVKDGRILAVGSKSDVLSRKGAGTKVVELGAKALVPGFVDAHSHFSAVGLQALSANLLPPPDGPVKSIAELQAVLREFIAKSPTVKAYGLAIGFNYDDSQLAEQRSPTAEELDQVSTTVPILVIHQSAHLAVLNTMALAKAGWSAASPDPTGGVIRRKQGGQEPNGVLEENAFFLSLPKLLPKFTAEQGLEQLHAAQAIYLANGFTTVQDGRTDPPTLALLAAAAKAGTFVIDVVSYPDLDQNAKDPILHGPWMAPGYASHFRLGGVKLTFDGSPQGKTAWMTQPYLEVPEGQPASYVGYPSFPDAKKAADLVKLAYQNHWQLLVHANGDAAIEQLLDDVRAASAAFPGADRRTTLIHGQYVREDQVARMKELGIFPALFPMHTFYWGDWHRDSVAGPERAENISPMGWLAQRGMPFSIHSDAPVTFPNSMRVLDSAVNRTTRSGRVLGPQHRLEPLVALKAMTLWSAHQHFEEKTKGSLAVGKLADLVILDGNPVEVDPKTLKDLKVVETIKEGRTVYRAR
ncbi:MAG: amidohydrolase [Planctomycetes bacterium]|nr:amidohydrolase [Planctomycetota bacterium]